MISSSHITIKTRKTNMLKDTKGSEFSSAITVDLVEIVHSKKSSQKGKLESIVELVYLVKLSVLV